MNDLIDRFLASGPYAVVGASRDRTKFGNRVLRCYMEQNEVVHPVHPAGGTIEDLDAAESLLTLPEQVAHVSVVTPPAVTEAVVEEAGRAGVEILWMQPGAENEAAVARAEALGMGVIHGGPCLLIDLPRLRR